MIELSKTNRKDYTYKANKRESQRKYNILNDNILKISFKEDKTKEKRYSNYNKELQDIKIYSNEQDNIYKIDIDKNIFYLRDKIELSFFFNKYFSIEYLENKDQYKNFIDFHKSKDFYKTKEDDFYILDYKTDITKK